MRLQRYGDCPMPAVKKPKPKPPRYAPIATRQERMLAEAAVVHLVESHRFLRAGMSEGRVEHTQPPRG